MAQIQIFEQKDFTGGLNLRSDQFQLANNESPEMLNVEVDPRGGVFSRGGMTRINPTNVTGAWLPDKLYPFYNSGTHHIMLSNNNNVFHSTGADFTRLDVSSGVPIVSTSPHGVCFASWGTTLYMSLGQSSTAGAYKWDGAATYATNLTRSGSSPNNWQTRSTAPAGKFPQCEHIAVHANKMWAANTTEGGVNFPNRIRFSDESLPENWVEEDYLDIQGGGPSIIAIVSVNGVLLVFKQSAVYAIYGYDYTDFRIVPLSEQLGCSSHHALAASDTGVYFFSSSHGLFYTNGNSVVDLFQPLRPLFDLGYINNASEESISVSWIGRRVWLSLPYSQTTPVEYPSVNFVFDPTMNSYTMFQTADNKGLVGGCDFTTQAGVDMRVAIHPSTPAVMQVDRYSIDSDYINVDGSLTGFASYYRTKWFDAGSYMQRKMFRRPELVLRETDSEQILTVKVYHDFQEALGSEKREFNLTQTSITVGLTWGENWALEPAGGTPYGESWSNETLGGAIATASNLGLCKTVQLRFSGQATKPWGINSIGYKWSPRRVKG